MCKEILNLIRIIRNIFITVFLVLTTLLILVGLILRFYKDPWTKKILQAGYIEKSVLVNQVTFSYVEGPDNGAPLVLLHAQHMDWFSYSRVLPELSRYFHVFNIDYPGHGTTRSPDNYPMNASQIGNDLGDFIKQVIGHPVYITGNSSGGLLTTWLGANRQEMVKAILLEDPPLFSAEYPRIQQTIANRSFKTSYNFVKENGTDFLLYWIKSNSIFFDNYIFKGSANILEKTIKFFRFLNPKMPIEISVIPNDTVRLFIRGLDKYDARFGAAFYDGTWNKGFDHTDVIRRIRCPVLLLHANHRILGDGTLDGAMSDEEANKVMSLLRNGKHIRINASHVVHLDKPDDFMKIIKSFFLKKE